MELAEPRIGRLLLGELADWARVDVPLDVTHEPWPVELATHDAEGLADPEVARERRVVDLADGAQLELGREDDRRVRARGVREAVPQADAVEDEGGVSLGR